MYEVVPDVAVKLKKVANNENVNLSLFSKKLCIRFKYNRKDMIRDECRTWLIQQDQAKQNLTKQNLITK